MTRFGKVGSSSWMIKPNPRRCSLFGRSRWSSRSNELSSFISRSRNRAWTAAVDIARRVDPVGPAAERAPAVSSGSLLIDQGFVIVYAHASKLNIENAIGTHGLHPANVDCPDCKGTGQVDQHGGLRQKSCWRCAIGEGGDARDGPSGHCGTMTLFAPRRKPRGVVGSSAQHRYILRSCPHSASS